MSAVIDGCTKHVGKCCVNIGRSCERVNACWGSTWPGNDQWNMTERFVHRYRWFAPNVATLFVDVAKVVTVVCAQNYCSVRPSVGGVKRIKDLAKPVIDHRKL